MPTVQSSDEPCLDRIRDGSSRPVIIIDYHRSGTTFLHASGGFNVPNVYTDIHYCEALSNFLAVTEAETNRPPAERFSDAGISRSGIHDVGRLSADARFLTRHRHPARVIDSQLKGVRQGSGDRTEFIAMISRGYVRVFSRLFVVWVVRWLFNPRRSFVTRLSKCDLKVDYAKMVETRAGRLLPEVEARQDDLARRLADYYAAHGYAPVEG